MLNYFNRKGVIYMAEKKGNCGCGCIGEKPSGEKPARDEKKDRKSN